MKTLIIGSSGQDGFYLSKLLEQKGLKYRSISRNGDDVNGDVSSYSFISEQIKTYQPNYIFHFAAVSSTNHKFLFENSATIYDGTINILEAVKLYCPNCRVFISGSALQFKNSGLPISEKSDFDPNSAYSVARINSTYAARYYRNFFGIKVYVGYFFNHDSPLRTENHINQKVIKTAQRIKMGSAEFLEMGDVTVKKEFNFAGDLIEAIWQLVNQDEVFEATIGNGKAYAIIDWIEYCFRALKLDPEEFVKNKTDFNSEYRILVSDPSTIFTLGWKPKYDIYQLADLMLYN